MSPLPAFWWRDSAATTIAMSEVKRAIMALTSVGRITNTIVVSSVNKRIDKD
jgi:hypothetical protein